MPATLYTNPAGDTFQIVRPAAESGGRVLEMEVAFVPHRPAPPMHRHPRQTEHFTVVAGVVEVRYDDATRQYRAGEAFEIAPGVAHTMHNPGEDLLRMRWTVTPALRTEHLFRALWSLASTGRTDRNGVPPLLQSAVLFQHFADEFELARPPRPIQRMAFGVLAVLGRLRGYRTQA